MAYTDCKYFGLPTPFLAEALPSRIRVQRQQCMARRLVQHSQQGSRPAVICLASADSGPGVPPEDAAAPQTASQGDVGDSPDGDSASDDEPEINRNPLSSRLIHQEIILFCFQQDVEASLMRALNMDETDRAQYLRSRLQTIDQALQEIQRLKDSDDARTTEVASRQEDDFAVALRLRGSLQDAIVEERYEEAAKLRDQLKILNARLEEASGRAERAREKLREQRQLRLGQRVIINPSGHRGVICGWDASCSETREWQDDAGVQDLESKGDQPFYLVLVDWGDALSGGRDFMSGNNLVVYAAQEMLSVPEPAKTWVEAYGSEEFENPYSMKMFLGNDECGDYLPCRALRDKYSQQRRDVQPPPSMQSDSDDDDSERRLQELLQQQNLDRPSDSSDDDTDGGYQP